MELFAEKGKLVPRPYQVANHDESFLLYDRGHRGVLTRAFTGSGKTPMSCMMIETWLARGQEHRAMVISYETHLVWQFAQEIEEFLGISAGIEMDKEHVNPERMPRVVVCSRASLLRNTPPDQSQIDELQMLGISEIGAIGKRECKTILRHIRKGVELDVIREQIREFNERPEVANGCYSRVHKFNWRTPWLLIFDEAHRHTKKLVSVGHIFDWFMQNPNSWRHGLTATPKRGDGTSIGHKMFPGIALDYPLFSTVKPCGVKDGYAVPYVQKYIEVAGVDFKSLKKIAGDYDPDELERRLGTEAMLAKLVEPLLDMVGDRRCLIFNPGVQMAKDVALYINSRVKTTCPKCGTVKWFPRKIVGDGAQCKCGELADESWIATKEPQAEAIWGAFADEDRKDIYRRHQNGSFQFLSVCGLCREGYNDPDIGAVAIFRLVSKKASSLAEQMKGRACRPCRAIVKLLNETDDAEERCRIIRESSKPNALIVDLTGVTGLADCASTVQIYSEGLPDEVKSKAEELLLAKGTDEETDVEEVIEEAKRVCAEERERIRKEREEAERREQEEFEKVSKAQAQVDYTVHDMGVGSNVDPNLATSRQINFVSRLGLAFHGYEPTRRIAGKAISLLRQRKPIEEVAAACWLKDGQWSKKGPSQGELRMLQWKRLPMAKTGYDAGLMINAKLNPEEFKEKTIASIKKASNEQDLTNIAMDMLLVKNILPPAIYQAIVAAGRNKRYSWKGDAAE